MDDRSLKMGVSIGRVICNQEDDFISIEVTDEASGVQFLSVKVPLGRFAQMVTGLLISDLEADVRCLRLVGMRSEHRDVLVPFDHYEDGEHRGPASEKELAALAPFEVDGWTGRFSDIRNSHRTIRDGEARSQLVTFYRHVNPETEEPVS